MNRELLEKITNAMSVSGDEGEVRKILKKELEGHVDEMRTDVMGNLIVLKKGTGAVDMKVLIDAHMDEVGFMITGFDGDGGIKFVPVGGFDDRVLLGKRVSIGQDKGPGVIGAVPVHLSGHVGNFNGTQKTSQLRMDIGASKKEQASGKVSEGDYATFDVKFREIGDLVCGRGFDNRGSCARLAELLMGDPFPFDVYGCFTVQEEIGLRGASVIAYQIEPDAAFVFENTICADFPQDEDKDEDETPITKLGDGPAITVMDRSMIADPRLVQFLIQTADENGIPHQFKAPAYGGTDGGAIHRSIAGVPTAAVSVPTRYIHSPAAMFHPDDYDNANKLMRAALNKLTPEVIVR